MGKKIKDKRCKGVYRNGSTEINMLGELEMCFHLVKSEVSIK